MNQTPKDQGTQGEPFDIDEPVDEALYPPPQSDNEKMLAGLSYASQIIIPALLPVILLVSGDTKHSRFLRYHAIQSIALLIVSLLYYLVAALVYVLASALAPCLVCVLWIVFLPPAGAMLYYGLGGFRGEYVDIPYLTRFLKDNNWL